MISSENPDRRPGGIRSADVAILHRDERLEMCAQIDVVGGQFEDVAQRRLGGLEIHAQVAEGLFELRRRVRMHASVFTGPGDA